MLETNPFSLLSEVVPTVVMQGFYNCNGSFNCLWNNYSDDTPQKFNLFL